MTDTLELTVESLGAAGDGVARMADGPKGGGLVFLPQTLPGERLRASLPTGKRGDARLAEAEGGCWTARTAWRPPARISPPAAAACCSTGPMRPMRRGSAPGWSRRWPAPASRMRRSPPGGTPPGCRQRADLGLRLPEAACSSASTSAAPRPGADCGNAPCCCRRWSRCCRPLAEPAARLEGAAAVGSAVMNMLGSGPDMLLRTDGR